MNSEIWQQLLQLESRDFVSNWFNEIHNRELNARRSKEIIASARQGREYFRSASTASFAVRPLLAFYGVASLCRALTLLHRRDSGEEGLKQGHGLETVAWAAILSNNLPSALASIGKLRVRTCAGLFSDLQEATCKRSALNVYDRTIYLPAHNIKKPLRDEISFTDILERLPDLSFGGPTESLQKSLRIEDFVYSAEIGAKIVVHGTPDHPVCVEYANAGFRPSKEETPYATDSEKTILEIDKYGFEKNPPQLISTRVIRTISGYPSPHLVSKFYPDMYFSQLSITYMLSFIIGMLARYFPTHWSALMGGEKGDAIWPSINAGQIYVEQALPDLVLEVIRNSLNAPDNSITNESE